MKDLVRPVLAVHQPNFAPWLGWFAKAAAAVAAGIVPLANASDGGGSIRIPSRSSPRGCCTPVRRWWGATS
mgnify:CR=1 FL=1